MVLEFLIDAKSAITFFDQSEGSIVVMWLPKEAPDRNFSFFQTTKPNKKK